PDQIGSAHWSRSDRGNAQTLAKLIQHALRAAHRRLVDPAGIDRRSERAMEPEVHAERAVGQLAHAPDHRAQLVGRHVEPGRHAGPRSATSWGRARAPMPAWTMG